MKVLYSAMENKQPIPISGGDGYQFLILWIECDNDWYVYYSDELECAVYLNRIINKMANGHTKLFHGDNFARVDSDEAYDEIMAYINRNYNYAGLDQSEDRFKIHGLDHLTPVERQIVDKLNSSPRE